MKLSDVPKKMPVPFAINGTREDLLATAASGDNTASYNNGFPDVTMLDESAGGIPPKGQDFNQILFEVGGTSRWSNAGGAYLYDADFSTAIGGYPNGAVVLGSDNVTRYQSIIDDNTNNPNSTTTGWLNISAGSRRGAIKVFTSSGSYTPTTGTKFVEYIVTGGGGGGHGASASASDQSFSGGGGGAGGTAMGYFTLTGASSYAVVVGTGGAGSSITTANDGGASTFAGVTANGGKGATHVSASASAGGAGGTATGGTINIQGGYGNDGQSGSYMMTGNGGASYWGGGGRGASQSPVPGTAYGSGGGGVYDVSFTGTAYTGGAGKSGIVVIYEYFS